MKFLNTIIFYLNSYVHYVFDYLFYKHKYFNGRKLIELGSNIVVIENIVTNDYCDELVALIEESPLTRKEYSKENYNNVECFEFILTASKDIDKYKIHDDKVFSIINECFSLFKQNFTYINIATDSGYSLRKIYGQTHEHIDWLWNNPNERRSVSIIIVLNDNYDGGVFEFKSQNIKYKVKKGSAIMFPPYWTHPHNVSTVNPGQYRYTINTWGNSLSFMNDSPPPIESNIPIDSLKEKDKDI